MFCLDCILLFFTCCFAFYVPYVLYTLYFDLFWSFVPVFPLWEPSALGAVVSYGYLGTPQVVPGWRWGYHPSLLWAPWVGALAADVDLLLLMQMAPMMAFSGSSALSPLFAF
jgi:hypothetical protein